jgi:hypothetical protein
MRRGLRQIKYPFTTVFKDMSHCASLEAKWLLSGARFQPRQRVLTDDELCGRQTPPILLQSAILERVGVEFTNGNRPAVRSADPKPTPNGSPAHACTGAGRTMAGKACFLTPVGRSLRVDGMQWLRLSKSPLRPYCVVTSPKARHKHPH